MALDPLGRVHLAGNTDSRESFPGGGLTDLSIFLSVIDLTQPPISQLISSVPVVAGPLTTLLGEFDTPTAMRLLPNGRVAFLTSSADSFFPLVHPFYFGPYDPSAQNPLRFLLLVYDPAANTFDLATFLDDVQLARLPRMAAGPPGALHLAMLTSEPGRSTDGSLPLGLDDVLLFGITGIQPGGSNNPPMANAGPDQTTTNPDVLLDGSASSDPDGDALSFAWTEGPATLGNEAQISVSLGAGTHTITLTVTDSHGASATDTVVVTVQGADLTLAATASASQIHALDSLTYRVLLANSGPLDASPVRLNVTLPPGMEFVSASRPACSLVTPTLICDFAALASAQSLAMTIEVKATLVGPFTTSFSLSSPVADPNPATDIATLSGSADLFVAETVRVSDNNPTPQPALMLAFDEQIRVSDNDPTPQPALMLAFTERIVVSDTNPPPAIVILDTTPPVVVVPPSITIAATEGGGARGNVPASTASNTLKAFLAGGSATDDSDPSPVRLTPKALIANVVVDATDVVLFPTGPPTIVTFSFQDASGNIGSATSTVTVLPLNVAPTLDPIPDQTQLERTVRHLSPVAHDTAGDTLRFSLIGAVPPGLSVSEYSGFMSWLPRADQGPGVYPVTLRVTDSGGLFAERSFTWTVTDIHPNAPGTLLLDTNDVFATFTREGQLGVIESPNVLAVSDQSGNVGNLFASYPFVDNDTDLVVTFQVRTASPLFADAGLGFVINRGNGNPVALVARTIVSSEGFKGIGLAAGTDYAMPSNYPAFVPCVIESAPAHGTLSGAAPNVTYTPFANFSGSDSFTFTANDGTADSNVAVVSITVNAVNDAPVNSVPAAQATAAGLPLLFSIAGGNPISIADVDAGTNPMRVTLAGINGTVTLGGTAGLTFIAGDGSADPTVTFSGTTGDINAAFRGMRFNPNAGFAGTARVTVTTDDRGQTGAGGPAIDIDDIAITVGPGGGAALSLTMIDAPDPVTVGSALTYSVQVSNRGPFAATTVTVADTLPAGVAFVSATASQGSCTFVSLLRAVVCSLGSVANGDAASITMVARPSQRGSLTNVATVIANQYDSNYADNYAQVTTRVR
jgi:uncharacterized repeat protein (TIGR01451 family)